MREVATKVPPLTLGFWIVKILATTLGETAGDTVTITWLGETTPNSAASAVSGYLLGTILFGLALIVLVWVQIKARTFHPWLYWATIIASTTMGTTLADFATRSLGIGCPGGSILLLGLDLAPLCAWHRSLGSVSLDSTVGARAEAFY